MRRYAAIFSLLIIAFSSAVSFACEDPPLPLRGMFLESHLIVIGKIGAPGKWKAGAAGESADYRTLNRRFPIIVEKTLKGVFDGDLYVSETTYNYLGDENPKNTVNLAPDAGFESELAKDTGRRLFFLQKNDKGEFEEIYHNRAFVPKGKDFDLYIERLNELRDMYKNGEPAKERIVEWLVSMAENPVTRFEGAYELRGSFYDAKYKAEEAVEDAKKDHSHSLKEELETSSNPENSAEGDGDHEEFRSYGEAEFAHLLTASQKERLIRAFMSVRFIYEPKKYEDSEDVYVEVLNEADRNLVEAVAQIGDLRVARRLLNEIPTISRHESYLASSLLESIAAHFQNPELGELVRKYSEVAYGGEGEIMETKSSAYDLEAVSEDERAAMLAKLPNKTYGQRRAELLEKIAASCAMLMAKK